MTPLEALDVARDALWTTVILAAPVMLVGLVVGVIVALFQALTQVQEPTLSSVPKIITIFIILVLTLPLMGGTLSAFMARMSEKMVGG